MLHVGFLCRGLFRASTLFCSTCHPMCMECLLRRILATPHDTNSTARDDSLCGSSSRCFGSSPPLADDRIELIRKSKTTITITTTTNLPKNSRIYRPPHVHPLHPGVLLVCHCRYCGLLVHTTTQLQDDSNYNDDRYGLTNQSQQRLQSLFASPITAATTQSQTTERTRTDGRDDTIRAAIRGQ